MEEFIRRLAQRHGSVMRAKGLTLDDHAVIGRICRTLSSVNSAPLRPVPGSESAADFALQRSG